MDYEKEYREALERAKQGIKDCGDNEGRKNMIYNIFPELKESKEEKIRKNCIHFLELQKTHHAATFEIDECIEWLEKQGEQKQDPRYSIVEDLIAADDIFQMSVNESMVKEAEAMALNAIQKLEVSKLLGLEKQKPIDKVEPKFKVGNWYQCTKDFFGKGVSFDKNTAYYCAKEGCLQDEYGCHIAIVKDLYDNFRLWTIQDAKDGDVVVDKSDGTIGIFQSIGHHPDGGSYNDPSYCFLHCRYDDGFFYADFEHGNTIDSDNLIPATKEQCDLLFTKMNEAGYKWDAEKKELKKLTQSATKKSDQDVWSEDDEHSLKGI